MDEAIARALARIRQGDPLDELAAMVVDHTTATPLREIASPRWIAGQLKVTLEAASGPAARGWADRRLDREQGRFGTEDTLLGARMPEEVETPLRELLGRPWSPNEELAFKILDQGAIRDVLRMVLTNGILRFRRRLKDVDQSVLGGLGKRAAKRGRGLLGGLTETVGRSNITGMASDLVGSLKDEVEGSLEGRVKEYARQAAREQVRAIAGYLADPENAEAFASLRLSVLDVLLETPTKDLVAELENMGPREAMDVVFAAVSTTVAAPDFIDRTEDRILKVLDSAGDGTLGAWLEEIDLLDVWRETTTELVAMRLRAVVGTDEFEAWWLRLFAEADQGDD